MKIVIPSKIYSKKENDNILITSAGEEDFYFRIEGHFHQLWLLIDGEKSRDELLGDFAKILSVESEDIKEDVFEFIDELLELEILKEID